jgi:hypothetical protein
VHIFIIGFSSPSGRGAEKSLSQVSGSDLSRAGDFGLLGWGGAGLPCLQLIPIICVLGFYIVLIRAVVIRQDFKKIVSIRFGWPSLSSGVSNIGLRVRLEFGPDDSEGHANRFKS